ncbi:MAG: hypothetical protein LBL82_00280 [Oscillospiraceae bacterium]|jgi:hypothetical protein|nr:hypothetical protein [Oscillospiraceae bacterium]
MSILTRFFRKSIERAVEERMATQCPDEIEPQKEIHVTNLYQNVEDPKLRQCIVNGKEALFCRWNIWNSCVLGMIEYGDGQVEEVAPSKIKFCDHNDLWYTNTPLFKLCEKFGWDTEKLLNYALSIARSAELCNSCEYPCDVTNDNLNCKVALVKILNSHLT